MISTWKKRSHHLRKKEVGDRHGMCLFTDSFLHAANIYGVCLVCPRHWKIEINLVLTPQEVVVKRDHRPVDKSLQDGKRATMAEGQELGQESSVGRLSKRPEEGCRLTERGGRAGPSVSWPERVSSRVGGEQLIQSD